MKKTYVLLLVLLSSSTFSLCSVARGYGLEPGIPGEYPPLNLNVSAVSLDEINRFQSGNNASYQIAASEQQMISITPNAIEQTNLEYKDRIFTGNKMHQYLGIGSLVAAALTIISPKEEDGPHEYFAKTSAFLGGAAVVSGFYYHYEDLNFSAGTKDPDNMHALFAGLGALGIALAASTGPDNPHATYGSLGAIGMLVGIRYAW